MKAYQDLMAFEYETQALSQISGRLSWDQETVMPRGSSKQRSEEMAAIESVLHARRTDDRLGEWLAAINTRDLKTVERAQVREISRSFERSCKIPLRLAKAMARLTSTAQGKWAEARAEDDFATFAPILGEVVSLKREEGMALAGGGDVYDAMLNDYEPGTNGSDLEEMFKAMRPELVDLRSAIEGQSIPFSLKGHFEENLQMLLSAKLALVFGYDTSRGRIDKAVHPFSSGSGHDVRITTRTNPQDPFNCLYSTIHEVGHASYEQNIDDAYLFTPLGRGVSMGVHESQSRIYENQLGRSRAFTGWLYGQMRDIFGDIGVDSEDCFYAAANRITDGYIRTESDEVQYNLHVLLRFDLERALMRDDLDVSELEVAWNDRFKSDFGYAVDKPSNGVLQDVHWSVGLFGYFPTYSLGNVYAGCLYEGLRAAVPRLDEQLAQGETSSAISWLCENLQQYGALYEPQDVIQRASGMTPSHKPLINYLKTKFGEIYDI